MLCDNCEIREASQDAFYFDEEIGIQAVCTPCDVFIKELHADDKGGK